MVSLAQPRSTHYATLGIEPDASDAAIERAFAATVSPLNPRPVGAITQASLAYMTLRDPARRRDYDQSIGLLPPPPPALPSVGYSNGRIVIAPGLLATASASALPSVEKASGIASDPPAFIASGDGGAGDWEPKLLEPAPTSRQGPNAFDLERALAEANANVRGERERPVALVAGGAAAVAVVALLGAWAGTTAIGENQSPEATPSAAVVMPLPPIAPLPSEVVDRPPASAATSPLLPPTQITKARHRTSEHTPAPVVMAQAQPDNAPSAEPAPNPDALATEPAPEAAPPSVVAATMPLSNATIARTLHRIGYGCGTVAGIEGVGSGVFTIACAGGQRYRASPVNGRYRFKRL